MPVYPPISILYGDIFLKLFVGIYNIFDGGVACKEWKFCASDPGEVGGKWLDQCSLGVLWIFTPR